MDKFYLNNVRTCINDCLSALERSEQITDAMQDEINIWRENYLMQNMPEAKSVEEIEMIAKAWRKFLSIPSDRMSKESPKELINACLKWAKEDI